MEALPLPGAHDPKELIERLDLSAFESEECPGFVDDVILPYLLVVARVRSKKGMSLNQDTATELENIFLGAIGCIDDMRGYILEGTRKGIGVAFDIYNSIPGQAKYNAFAVLKSFAHKHLPIDQIPEKYR
jgi:hypothetical protein